MREIVNTILRSTRGHCLALVAVGSAALADSLRLVFALSRSAPFEKINHVLVMADPERVGREASPTAAIIDSQSVKSAEKGGPASMRRVTTPARKSKVRSGMFSSIH